MIFYVWYGKKNCLGVYDQCTKKYLENSQFIEKLWKDKLLDLK